MLRRRLSQRGFTLIEIIVVIAVIGILATLTVVGFSRVQQEGRDAKRSSSAAVITEALEKYFDQNGEYPSCSALQAAGTQVTANTLQGIATETLIAPQAASGQTNSIKCTTLTLAGDDFFEYQGDGSDDCTGNVSCLSYTLRYKSESGNKLVSLNSRRTTTIASSSRSTLSSDSVGMTNISLSWTSIPSVSGYELQRATNAAFTTGLSTTTTTGLTSNQTSLSQGTTYYFRVRGTSPQGTLTWSNVVDEQTLVLGAPSITGLTATTNSFTANWSTVSGAGSYITQCSTDAMTWGSWCQFTPTTTSRVFTSAAPGTRYYVRVQAVIGSTAGPWSNTANVWTGVPQPAAFTISKADGNASSPSDWNAMYGTNNAVCQSGTTIQYLWDLNGSAWSDATNQKSVGALVGWDQTVTLNSRARCVVGSRTSAYVNSNNTISRTITGPRAEANNGNCAWRTVCWSGSCPAGTTNGWIEVRVSADGWAWESGANNIGLGPGNYSNTGQGWGDGNTKSATHCVGVWGKVTASGFGVFGPGCVPNITNPGRCYAD